MFLRPLLSGCRISGAPAPLPLHAGSISACWADWSMLVVGRRSKHLPEPQNGFALFRGHGFQVGFKGNQQKDHHFKAYSTDTHTHTSTITMLVMMHTHDLSAASLPLFSMTFAFACEIYVALCLVARVGRSEALVEAVGGDSFPKRRIAWAESALQSQDGTLRSYGRRWQRVSGRVWFCWLRL